MPGSTAAPVRRRPRSGRVTAAAGLLGATTGAGALALVAGEALRAALVAALVGGWLAVGLTSAELQLLRRQGARDRAWQAAAFRDHSDRLSTEHARFAAAMARRLAGRDREVRELEGTLRLSEARAGAAEDRIRREVRRVDEARSRIVELEVALAIRRAEEADELASWEPGGPEVDTVVDLLAWEDRARSNAASSETWRQRRRA